MGVDKREVGNGVKEIERERDKSGKGKGQKLRYNWDNMQAGRTARRLEEASTKTKRSLGKSRVW